MAQRAIHLASPIVCGKGNTVSLRMAAFSKGHVGVGGLGGADERNGHGGDGWSTSNLPCGHRHRVLQ